MTCAFLSASPALGQIGGEAFSQEVAQHFVHPPTVEAVKAKAAYQSKPIMVIIMSKTCAACRHLREGINNDKELQELMRSFVVAHYQDDPQDAAWKDPSQNYAPQTYFFTSAGERLEVQSPLAAQGFRYYFNDAPVFTAGCRKALELVAHVAEHPTTTVIPLADPSGGTRFLDEVERVFVKPPTMERVKEEAAKTGKPIMILIMTSWCTACKGLRYQINTGTRIRNLMEYFVVAYIDNDGGGAEWKTDQNVQYVPQTYFFNSAAASLHVESALASRGFKYSYTDEPTLLEGMHKALAMATHGSGHTQVTGPPLPGHEWASNITEHFFDSFEPQRIQDKAAAEGKPYMVILTQDWCDACVVLMQSVSAGEKVRNLLPSFVVSHAHGPDGIRMWQRKGEHYVPQTYFFNQDGAPLDVPAPNPQYRYFFSTDQELAAAMSSALELKSAAPEL